jgi:hypothetical protein
MGTAGGRDRRQQAHHALRPVGRKEVRARARARGLLHRERARARYRHRGARGRARGGWRDGGGARQRNRHHLPAGKPGAVSPDRGDRRDRERVSIRPARGPAEFPIIGTFFLVFVAAAISSDNLSPNGLAPGFGPFLVGLLVWGIGLSLGGPTGYAINPARDLGPRIMHAILPIAGKGSSGWDYAHVPILGPIIGAALAGIAVSFVGI